MQLSCGDQGLASDCVKLGRSGGVARENCERIERSERHMMSAPDTSLPPALVSLHIAHIALNKLGPGTKGVWQSSNALKMVSRQFAVHCLTGLGKTFFVEHDT